MKSKEKIFQDSSKEKKQKFSKLYTLLFLLSFITVVLQIPNSATHEVLSPALVQAFSEIEDDVSQAEVDEFEDSFQAYGDFIDTSEGQDFAVQRAELAANGEPNDPLFFQQWHWYNFTEDGSSGTNWTQLYQEIESLSEEEKAAFSEVIVVVMDSGLNYSHVDIPADAVFINTGEIPDNKIDDEGNGYVDDVHGCDILDLSGNCQDISDPSGHGTGVAGILLAESDNNEGIASDLGIPIKVMEVRVINESGFANYSDVTKALKYINNMVDAGYPIVAVNMSFAGWYEGELAADAELTALNEKGLVLVSGTGNSENQYPGKVGWPARRDEVIAVGGSGPDGCHYVGASYGPEIDVSAPYPSIYTLYGTDSYARMSGTSFSSPQVTFLAAILKSMNPDLSPAEVSEIITSTANLRPECDAEQIGSGVVDYMAAFLSVKYPNETFLPFISNGGS